MMRSKALGFAVLTAMLALSGCGGGDDGGNTPSGGTSGGGMPAGGSGSSGMSGGGSGMSSAGSSGSTAGASGMGSGGRAGMSTSGSGGTMPTAGSGGTPPGGDCATDEVKEGMCKENRTGVFAIKTVIDVWWQDDITPPLIDSGRGPITVYLRGELTGVCEDGSGGIGTIKGCGTELPAFRSDANCEAYQIEIPDEIWDQPSMPSFMTTGMSSGFNPGDILTLNTASGLVGIDLESDTATWPTSAETGTFSCGGGKTGAQCFPDDDGDGKPGITIRIGKIGQRFGTDTCTNTEPYMFYGAPLDVLSALDHGSTRANTLQIGLRTRLGGQGMIGSDCASGVGDATAENLDSRVLDCATTDNQPCDAAQATFVDDQAPTYNILAKGAKPPSDVVDMKTGEPIDQSMSPGTRSAIVRLGDLGETFDCAAVRGANYPAL